MSDRDGDRAEGRRSSVEQESTESSKFDGIGNFGTDASGSQIGSVLGAIDRYFHSNFLPSFAGLSSRLSAFISALSSLIPPLQPYCFLSTCSYPFSGHHIGTLAPLSSPFASPVPNPKGFHHWLFWRCSTSGNRPPLKSLLKHWASDT